MPVCDTQPKRCFWILQLVFALGVPCVQAQSRPANPPKITQIKLEQYGWQRLPPPARHEAWPTEAQLMRVDSKGRVVIGCPGREGTELATRGNPKLSFHVLRFTPEGKLDLSVSLPTDNLPDNAVFLDAQDRIFVVANQILQMLTGDDQTPTQQRTWKPLTSCSWSSQYCQISQPPSRRKLFVIRCLGPVQRKLCDDPVTTAYDTSSSEPQVIKACVYRASRSGMLSDTFGYGSGWKGGTDRPLYFTRRRPLCNPDAPQELPLDDLVCAVLNDDLFVVDRLDKKKRWEMGVVTAHGDAKFRLRLAKHESPALSTTYAKGDALGDRLAFVIDTLRGGSSALDIGGHLAARRVAVYSSESGAQLISLSVYPPVPHYGVALGIVPGFTFDLGPEGDVLAVLSEGVLTIAEVE